MTLTIEPETAAERKRRGEAILSEKARSTATRLLWFQVICGIIFTSAQAIRMLTSTKGVSVSFFICVGAFAVINLVLSIAAYREAGKQDAGVKRQAIYIYSMWTTFAVIHFSIALWKMPRLWSSNDTLTMTIVGVGSIITVLVGKLKGMPLRDPYMRACLAAFLKCVPQVTLAVNIYLKGSSGLSGIWIFMGHVTILTRLVHLHISSKEGWNRNTRASFWSEIGNETSWLVASIAWLLF